MFEYKVVPAPVRAAKVKGLKTTHERFAHTLAERINAEAAGGWQFQRVETLSCEERKFFGGTKASTQVVMIFARDLDAPRPDAGAALAAAQLAPAVATEESAAPEEASFEADPDTAFEPYDTEPTYEPDTEPQHETEPAPRVELRAEPRSELRTEPRPEHAATLPPRRQEPLFRANPMMRQDPAGRAEPVLRPHAPRGDDE
ncbi:hypothetical protein [Pararhodobacter oceanensis]|uniref:hypothetical protein n=1 Tax=Pararhodobacter oceanensis TaxID=2172121 RepID=UPI003A8E204F